MSNAAVDTLDKVSGEFEDEVLADLQHGRAQALAVMEVAKRETLEEVTKILQTGSKQAESLKRQILGTAELDVRNGLLKSMEVAVNKAITAAVNGISKVSAERYSECIQRLIQEGVDVIGTKVVVECTSDDRKVVTSIIQRMNKGETRLTLSPDALDVKGGVVLRTSDGSIRFDNTFEARLERIRPSLRKDVAAILGRKG
jgi:V/A-type H+/Na+-transporting ATPase subunit E